MSADNNRYRVLFVDDEDNNLRAYQRLFKKNLDMVFAHSADAAMELMEKTSFDAIVSDYLMPGHHGVWLLEQAKRTQPQTKRVLLTGSNVSDLETHINSGLIHKFFSKPVARNSLLEFLNHDGGNK